MTPQARRHVGIRWLSLGLGVLLSLLSCQAYVGKEKTILTYFYLVNETGQEVKVRVLADGVELFVQRIYAEAPPSSASGFGEAPPPPSYPAVELKVPISSQAKQLEVQELLHLGTRARQATFDIADFSHVDAGFRVVIRKDGILLDQDYLPAR